MSFCDHFSYNPFNRNFLLSTIVFLTWCDLMSYSIVLPVSISALVLRLKVFFLGVLFYVATQIVHKGFRINELWRYFPSCPVRMITVFCSFCSWLMDTKVIVCTRILLSKTLFASYQVKVFQTVYLLSQVIRMFKYCKWGILRIFHRNESILYLYLIWLSVLIIHDVKFTAVIMSELHRFYEFI